MDVQIEQPFLTGEAAKARYEALRDHFSLMPLHATCVDGEPVMYFLADKAYGPGHVYSDAGREEFLMSGICEFHFDETTREEDE